MIAYVWKQHLDEHDVEEVLSLLKEAEAYDQEAGFSTVSLDTSEGARFLLVTMPPKGQRESPLLDRLPDVRVVAILRLAVADGWGTVQFVVRPDFRSLGLATLLFERLRDEQEGWAAVPGLAGVRAWAHGSHPAAERMRLRFGGELCAAVAKTVRHVRPGLGGSVPTLDVSDRPVEDAPEVVAGHAGALAPHDRDVWDQPTTRLSVSGIPGAVCVAMREGSRIALLTLTETGAAREGDLMALCEHGFRHAVEADVSEVRLYVDALDDQLVRVARLLEFEHDQSDLLYLLSAS